MKRRIFKISLLSFLFISLIFSQKRDILNSEIKHDNRLVDDHSILDINNLQYWFTNYAGVTPILNPSSLPRPKFVMPFILFQDGPVLGGLVDGFIRLVGSTYYSVFRPGSIKNGESFEPYDPKTRIYQIRKDWQKTEREYERKKYESNYKEWPADMGAPYELDSSGKKIPKFIGDEQAWWVMNDLSVGLSIGFYGTLPIGTEWQCLVWGYNKQGPLMNTFFKKCKIINKGNNNAMNCYFSYWGDPDIGDGTDDLSGSDSVLNMGYAYNGKISDEIYGNNPPALGFTLLQGPAIYTGNYYDEADWDFSKKRGFKNLKTTSFVFMTNENLGEIYIDTSSPKRISERMYNRQKGLKNDGNEWINPKTGKATTFLASGDPIEKTGWIDGNGNDSEFLPGDKKIMLSTGPFNLMKNDTQEVIIAISVGQGADRLSSIGVLKYYSMYTRGFFKSGMNLNSIDIPITRITENSNKVILNWMDEKELYKKIESYNSGGYRFEGYKVYQLPTNMSEKLYHVATFDLQNGVRIIYDKEFDTNSGVVLQKPVQYGSDNGIKREITLDKDVINNRNLINGQKYYYAVVAYAYNPDPITVPSIIESPLKIIEAVPQGAKSDVKAITVYPNPYYMSGIIESNQYDRYLTFNHLPPKVIIRIFTLSGSLVKTINKNDETQFVKWNLLNERNILIASGMYIAHIEMPELNKKKILKFSVIMDNMIFN